MFLRLHGPVRYSWALNSLQSSCFCRLSCTLLPFCPIARFRKMHAVMVPSYRSHPALARSSLDISRLSSTAGKRSGGRDSPKQEEVVVGTGNLPLLKRVETLPLLAHSSSSLQNPTSWQRWVAGVFIAFSILVVPMAAAEVLSLAMLDSESTTGPITQFLLSRQEQRARDDFSERVSEAVEWLEKGQLAQARGDFSAALDCFSEVTEKAGDLALAEYARVGHAVTLYEVGDKGQAIIEMEGVSISLKGYPEIHAALAAALYADKNALIPAEKQFTLATLLDPRYTNLVWVQETKHWPPSLLKSLQKFISSS